MNDTNKANKLNINSEELNNILNFNYQEDNWFMFSCFINYNSDQIPYISMALYDNFNKVIEYCEFTDNNFYTNLEVNIIHKLPDEKLIKTLFLIFVPTKYQEELIKDLLRNIKHDIKAIINISDININGIYINNNILLNKSKLDNIQIYYENIFHNINENDFSINNNDNNNLIYNNNLNSFNLNKNVRNNKTIKNVDKECLSKQLKELISLTNLITGLYFNNFYKNYFYLIPFENKQSMSIDLSTLTSLNIINCTLDNSFNNDGNISNIMETKNLFDKRVKNFINNQKDSVYDILNVCSTSMGSRKLKQLMLNPLQDINEINKRLDFLEFFLSNKNFTITLKDNLLKLMDIENLVIKLEKYETINFFNYSKLKNNYNNIRKSDLMDLNESLLAINSNILHLFNLSFSYIYFDKDSNLYHNKNNDNNNNNFNLNSQRDVFLNLLGVNNFYDPLMDKMNDLNKLSELLTKCLFFDDCDREVKINFSIDDHLNSIQEEINNSKELLNKEVKEANDIIGLYLENSNKNKSQKKNRRESKITTKANMVFYKEYYCISTTKVESDALNSNKNYKLKGSTKNNSYFITKEMEIYSLKLKELTNKYEEFSKTLLNKIISVVITYIPILQELIYIIGDIDIISTFASIILKSNNIYTRPIIEDNNLSLKRTLNINKGRHFILDQNQNLIVSNYKKSTKYVPNNCFLTYDKSNSIEETLMLITGLNMGGKTTYIRQVGIIVYLAHIGFYIPAEDNSIIPITDKIITRVGADDNLLKGMSTFYKEMVEVNSMLQNATSKSLLLVDEIGRGTSSKYGKCLSASIMDYIVSNIKSFCIFSTHFHELTSIKINGVAKYYIDYKLQNNNLDIKYTLIKGVCNTSLGMQLIKMLNIKELENINDNNFMDI